MSRFGIIIFRFFRRLLKYLAISFVVGVVLTLIIPFFGGICRSNKALTSFDIIVVLGNPATDDCQPGIIMKGRVEKGISLFNKGYADRILFTGNAVRNDCVEAEVMATYAISRGLPETSILIENRAENTFQNAYYSIAKIQTLKMKKVAIVTSKPHVKRACVVFSKYDIEFEMFPVETPKKTTKTQQLLWEFGERMILTHHIVFGYPDDF